MTRQTLHRNHRPLSLASLGLALGLALVSRAGPAQADKNAIQPRDEVAEKAAGRTFITTAGDVCVWHTGAVLELVDQGNSYTADGVPVAPDADIIMDTGGLPDFLLVLEARGFDSFYQVLQSGVFVANYVGGDQDIIPLEESTPLWVSEKFASGGQSAPTNPQVVVKSGDCSEPPPMGGGAPDE